MLDRTVVSGKRTKVRNVPLTRGFTPVSAIRDAVSVFGRDTTYKHPPKKYRRSKSSLSRPQVLVMASACNRGQ